MSAKMTGPKSRAKSGKGADSARMCLLVLGMHRSGTSAFSGVLTELGCDHPATKMARRPDNERGYFESQKIHLFHNKLLDSAGSSWDSFGKIDTNWFTSPRKTEYHAKALMALEEEYGTSPLFVLKDPRICRLVPFWKEVLEDYGCGTLVAHIHRNPLEVAASLEARDGLPRDLSLLIWLRHVLDAEHGSRGLPRFFTSYARLLTNWSGVISALLAQLNLSLPQFNNTGARKVEAFLSADLKHQSETDEKLVENPLISEWIVRAYLILNRWAAQGETPDDYRQLDQIRESFDMALPAFSGLADSYRDLQLEAASIKSSAAQLPNLEAQLATKDDQIAALSVELEEARHETEALTGRLHEASSALEQRSHEVDEVRRDLEKVQASNATKDDQIQTLSSKLDTANASIKTRFSELANLTRTLVQKEDKIERHQDEISSLNATLSELHKHIDYSQTEIQALRSSSSWRVTRPLRRLSRLIRRH